MAQPRWMLAREILQSGWTSGVSFRPFPNSSRWWWLISSVFLIRISCHKTTHANGYYGAWLGWAVSVSVLPLKEPLQKDKQSRFCFPVSPPTRWQSSGLRGPTLGPGPLLSGRTVGAAAPHPQAPGRCLRDRLAAQLTRAPGHRHTWGHKAGREETGLCATGSASGVRGARAPQTSPSGQGLNGVGAQHHLPRREGRGASCHRARIRGSRISNWAGGKIPP